MSWEVVTPENAAEAKADLRAIVWCLRYFRHLAHTHKHIPVPNTEDYREMFAIYNSADATFIRNVNVLYQIWMDDIDAGTRKWEDFVDVG